MLSKRLHRDLESAINILNNVFQTQYMSDTESYQNILRWIEYKQNANINNSFYTKGLQKAIFEGEKKLHTVFQVVISDIISIGESNISTNKKRHLIFTVLKDINDLIKKNSFMVLFEYDQNVLEDINDLHLYNYEWIDKNDKKFYDIVLAAYRHIQYYNFWTKQNKVSNKRFKEKVVQLSKQYKELSKYLSLSSLKYLLPIPFYPQDTLYILLSELSKTYNKDIEDIGVQNILTLISPFERLPKKSKKLKLYEKKLNEFSLVLIQEDTNDESPLDYNYERYLQWEASKKLFP